MTHSVFIDGEVGTTGLQIAERLRQRDDIRLISLAEDERKVLEARVEAARAADVSILCLPDQAARDLAGALGADQGRLIDASTAHRVDPTWDFGFAELGDTFRAAIANSRRVSNPGCYSSAAIALLKPLVDQGIVRPDAPLSINAVSGYSGGGKGLIAEFESQEADGHFAYATAQAHKHIPEIVQYAGLSHQPIFAPSVGQFAQGMLVQIPLPFLGDMGEAAIDQAWRQAYGSSRFVRVVSHDDYGARIDPRLLNNTNFMDLSVKGSEQGDCLVAYALLDNLGKGASGAAVQNLNIMLGEDEGKGL